MTQFMKFIKYYVISMRLHFGFITAIAGQIGVSYYQYLFPEETISLARRIFIITVLFLAYGINQVINDYFGLPEDRINAPHRPMVQGNLNPKLALFTSVGLMFITGLLSFFFSPWASLTLTIGVLLNILYEYAKSISLLGNLIFGMSMLVCPFYAYFLTGTQLPESWGNVVHILSIAFPIYTTGLMTYYTYFKDYEGDKKQNKRTFIVTYGIDFAKKAGIAFSVFPYVLFMFLPTLGIFKWQEIVNNSAFIFIFVLSLFLQLWTASLYYNHPTGEKTYFNLETNIQSCVISLLCVLALIDGVLALYLVPICYIFIGFIFKFHNDAKS